MLAIALLPPGALACAPQDGASGEIRRTFRCDGGKTFQGRLNERQAIINTPSYQYLLNARTSSLGMRYVGKNTAFALDEDRAVLVGAADGPYLNCRERPAQRSGNGAR
jgi:hypothetical protein